MPTGSARVNWYGDDVKLIVDDAAQDVLVRTAFQVEGQAKANIQANGQIDTGFMLNSGYTTAPGINGHSAAQANARAQNPDGVMAPPYRVNDGAAVHFGAEYTIYQELANSFLYRALDQVKRQVGGTIETVARERGLD